MYASNQINWELYMLIDEKKKQPLTINKNKTEKIKRKI
jgi:hypothetical protein